jgi:hypothetical protein
MVVPPSFRSPAYVGLRLRQFPERGQRSSKEEVAAAGESVGLVQKIILGCSEEVWDSVLVYYWGISSKTIRFKLHFIVNN